MTLRITLISIYKVHYSRKWLLWIVGICTFKWAFGAGSKV